MGNVNQRLIVDGDDPDEDPTENGSEGSDDCPMPVSRRIPRDVPTASRTPFVLAQQNPLAPLPTPIKPGDCSRPIEPEESPPKGIPILITWNLGGNSVSIEGSWDNWSSRKAMHKSGKDHSILLVLPSGIYHYKFVVDGELRYIPDLPSAKDEADKISNILDVHDFVPESLDSVAGFEAPASPDAAYGWHFPNEEDFSKDAPILPSQLLESVLKTSDEPSVVKPQHVVLNHLFLEKGLSQRSLLALSLTHRFKSKYVSMVLYKPINR